MSLPDLEPPVAVVTVLASQLKQRVLVVGDVHGCLDELQALLHKANYADGRTSVVLVGDVCNKGPRSAETVAFCRRSGFLCVRGNHEHAALKVSQAPARRDAQLPVTVL
jgi:predicted phosphodiesterase